jgi:hypothetical protein
MGFFRSQFREPTTEYAPWAPVRGRRGSLRSVQISSSALCYNGRNGPCDPRVFANSLSSWSRASSVSHSPRTMPHLGQSIRNTSSPLSCAPNVKLGGVLQVEHTKISVPFRAFIPERCISIMRAPPPAAQMSHSPSLSVGRNHAKGGPILTGMQSLERLGVASRRRRVSYVAPRTGCARSCATS